MASRTAGAWGFLKNGLQALPLETGHIYRVGRQPESELRLQSRSVSVEHSVIEVDAPMTPRLPTNPLPNHSPMTINHK